MQLSQEVGLAPHTSYLLKTKPSIQVFTLFNISVDQFLFPGEESKKFTRRQLDSELDELNERGYIIM